MMSPITKKLVEVAIDQVLFVWYFLERVPDLGPTVSVHPNTIKLSNILDEKGVKRVSITSLCCGRFDRRHNWGPFEALPEAPKYDRVL